MRVKWVNDLVDEHGNYLPHLLPVDQTLHWANPPGGIVELGTHDRSSHSRLVHMPAPFHSSRTCTVLWASATRATVTQKRGTFRRRTTSPPDTPRGEHGTDFFKNKAGSKFGATWGPGFAVFQYPNVNRASTIWYHDHALGMTRLNVYAGPAGFYIVRGGSDGDDAVVDVRFGTPAVLPGPAPKANDKFPPNKTYYEIPVAIQDRSFNADGALFYPDTRAFFDGIAGPYVPDTDVSPIWNPEFFGNMIMVNGNTWPFQVVQQRRYRFRFLNGCQSRFLILDFNGIPGIEVWQIGNEGGFLSEPVNLTADHGNRLLMGLAERADVIVDFTAVPVGSHVLGNVGPDEPFGGGVPGVDFPIADAASTGQVLEFRVTQSVAPDPTTPPMFLKLPAITPLPAPTLTRRLALVEQTSEPFLDAPVEALLGTVEGDPNLHRDRLASRSTTSSSATSGSVSTDRARRDRYIR